MRRLSAGVSMHGGSSCSAAADVSRIDSTACCKQNNGEWNID
jgi:hypothetical protein